MISIKAAPETNRLNIRIIGVVDKVESQLAAKNIVQEVNKLKENFDVINDISRLKRGDMGSILALKGMMDFLKSRKVGRVVRVVGASKSGLMQFAQATMNFVGYKAKYVPTVADAEKFLDEKTVAEC